jgi:hypothetical protein
MSVNGSVRPFIAVREMAEPGAGALAIPFEIVGSSLEQFAFGYRFVRSMDRNQHFHNLQFRNPYIFYVNRFALRARGFELSVGQLERTFNYWRKTMRRALTNELEPSKQRGRHNALLDDAEAQIITWITRQAGKSQPVTRTDILHCYVKSFSQSITRG